MEVAREDGVFEFYFFEVSSACVLQHYAFNTF